jgi:hypothetical protein
MFDVKNQSLRLLLDLWSLATTGEDCFDALVARNDRGRLLLDLWSLTEIASAQGASQ